MVLGLPIAGHFAGEVRTDPPPPRGHPMVILARVRRYQPRPAAKVAVSVAEMAICPAEEESDIVKHSAGAASDFAWSTRRRNDAEAFGTSRSRRSNTAVTAAFGEAITTRSDQIIVVPNKARVGYVVRTTVTGTGTASRRTELMRRNARPR